MGKPKDQHCFNCGEYVGHFAAYDWTDTCCGKPECNREVQSAVQQEADEAAEAARADVYGRY